MSGFSPLDVINEVKIRPGIYDRKALPPPRWERKQQLWLEVAESVTPPEEWEEFSQEQKERRISEVTNKWKNLRDHFYREVKRIESGDTNKRKYVYYDDMEFVRPYIGYKAPPQKKRLSKQSHESSTEDVKFNDSDIDMDAFLKMSDDDECKITPKRESLNQTQSLNKTNSSTRKFKPKTKQTTSGQQVGIRNFDLLRKKDDAKNPTFQIRESDISFCLSLVQHLRELSGARKISAKIDMLKVLHKNLEEIEQNAEILKTEQYHEIEKLDDSEDDFDERLDPLTGKKRKFEFE